MAAVTVPEATGGSGGSRKTKQIDVDTLIASSYQIKMNAELLKATVQNIRETAISALSGVLSSAQIDSALTESFSEFETNADDVLNRVYEMCNYIGNEVAADYTALNDEIAGELADIRNTSNGNIQSLSASWFYGWSYDSGEKHTSTISTGYQANPNGIGPVNNGGTSPSAGGPTPGTSEPTPGVGGQTPGVGGQVPGDGGQTPGVGGQTPGFGGQTPGFGGQTPGVGGHVPGDGGQTPAVGGETPGIVGPTPGGIIDDPIRPGEADM